MTRSKIALHVPSPAPAADSHRAATAAMTLAVIVIVIALCRPVVGFAQDAALQPLEEAPVIIYDSPLDQRRAELRRALISDDEQYDNKRQRRRLSPEERDALNKELRAVLRGVYDDKNRLTQER